MVDEISEMHQSSKAVVSTRTIVGSGDAIEVSNGFRKDSSIDLVLYTFTDCIKRFSFFVSSHVALDFEIRVTNERVT